jgi:hypothetical protein
VQREEWLPYAAAADRVQRSRGTIMRWIRDGHLHPAFERVRAAELLAVDKRMRKQAKRPRRSQRLEIVVDGKAVGEASLNPATGKLTGDLVFDKPVRPGQSIELRVPIDTPLRR